MPRIIHKTTNLHLSEFHLRNHKLYGKNGHNCMFELLKNNEQIRWCKEFKCLEQTKALRLSVQCKCFFFSEKKILMDTKSGKK